MSRIDEEARKAGCIIVNLPLRNSLDFHSIMGIRRLLKQYKPVAGISHSGHDANCLNVAAKTIFRALILYDQKHGHQKKITIKAIVYC